MAKTIALFNNKGGVSKTTTTFHLGWILAEMGYSTLIVDTDPQCNLTGLAVNTSRESKLEDLYSTDISNIKDAISPVLEGTMEQIKAANCYEIPSCKQLYLLPGHIDFSKYDASYNIAETISGSLTMMQNVPGAIRHLLNETANKYSLDYILLDMSPSISATNANILMQSDYFIVPCAPDYFCYMAIKSLTNIFPKWNITYEDLRKKEIFKNANYKIKDKPPYFLGTIQQRYRPRNGSPARAFAEWIDEINNLVKTELVPVLKKQEMLLEDINTLCFDDPYNLINIADFNSLIAHSQEHSVPIFRLTQEQVERSGKVWRLMKENMDDFHATFCTLANRIITLTK